MSSLFLYSKIWWNMIKTLECEPDSGSNQWLWFLSIFNWYHCRRHCHCHHCPHLSRPIDCCILLLSVIVSCLCSVFLLCHHCLCHFYCHCCCYCCHLLLLLLCCCGSPTCVFWTNAAVMQHRGFLLLCMFTSTTLLHVGHSILQKWKWFTSTLFSYSWVCPGTSKWFATVQICRIKILQQVLGLP